MIEVVCNDRLGKKVDVSFYGLVYARAGDLLLTRAQVRVKCNADDTIGDLKKLIAAQVCVRHALRRRLQKHPVTCAQNSGLLRNVTLLLP